MKRRQSHRRLRKQLTEAEIVGAALRIAREAGVEDFSIRRLADELGASPMSLYHYFPNKEALVERAVDEILGRIATPSPDALVWKERLRACGNQAVHVLAGHPGIARFLLSGGVTPGVARLLGYLTDELQNAGFDDRTAQDCLSVYCIFLFGVIGSMAFALRPESSPDPRASQASRSDLQRWLDFGFDLLLEGFEQHLTPHARRRVDNARRNRGRSRNLAVQRNAK